MLIRQGWLMDKVKSKRFEPNEIVIVKGGKIGFIYPYYNDSTNHENVFVLVGTDGERKIIRMYCTEVTKIDEMTEVEKEMYGFAE